MLTTMLVEGGVYLLSVQVILCSRFPSNESDEMLENFDPSMAVKAGSQLLVACASLGWDLHLHPLVEACFLRLGGLL